MEVILLARLEAIPMDERNHEHHPELFSRLGLPGYDFKEINLKQRVADWRAALKNVPATLTSLTSNLNHETFKIGRMEPFHLVQEFAVRMEMRSKRSCKLYIRGCRNLLCQRLAEATAHFVPMSEEEFARENDGKKTWPP